MILRRIPWLALVAISFFACSGKGKTSQASPEIPECNDYLSEYQRCLALAGGDEIARQRTQALSDWISAATTSGDEVVRDAQRAKCKDGARRLREACQ